MQLLRYCNRRIGGESADYGPCLFGRRKGGGKGGERGVDTPKRHWFLVLFFLVFLKNQKNRLWAISGGFGFLEKPKKPDF
jgi:hypothetical protein